MERRIINHQIQIRAADDGRKILYGYAAVFDSPSADLGGFTEYVRKGAFTRSLKENEQKALWNHESSYLLGSTKAGTLRLWEDDVGLGYELTLPNTQMGNDVAELASRGDVDGNSFGFFIRDEEWDDSDKNAVKRYLNEVELFEISPTAFPAYPETSLGIRSAYDKYKQSEKKTVKSYENEKRIIEIMQMEV